MALDPLAVALLVASVFNRLHLRYAVGGAVASAILGEPRATHDLDVLAEIALPDVPALLNGLEADGFFDELRRLVP